jgi:TorA maturation chaperone TorD
MMEEVVIGAKELQRLSRLFSYPEDMLIPDDLVGIAELTVKDATSASLKALQAEYVRLFINALPELPCPPYGSFYIEGALMGESTVRLRNLHLSYGLQTDEMPDHVAVELEFMALLGAFSEEAASVRQDYEFVLDHLRRWLPSFLDRVEEHDRIGFYSNLSKHARKVLCEDS